MRKIGGLFNYEPSKPIENGYFSRICSPNDDLAFTMSGRCGIYYCLQDIALHDTRKVAYVPLDRKSTRLNSSHSRASRMPSSA